MRWLALLVLMTLGLAGCAEDPASVTEPPTGLTPEVDQHTAAICAVVVDPTVTPIEGAEASILVDGATEKQTSNLDGQFCFGKLPPGFYTVEVAKFGYAKAAVQAEAKQGVTNPPIINIQMSRLFAEDPYVEPFKFDGRLACHVQVGLTAPCVTDWTQLVPGCGSGCVPELRTLMGDARDFIGEVRGGWQAHVVEMTWERSSQATSSHMGLIMRDFVVGGGSHQFGAMEGTSPLWIRFDVGVEHPSHSGGDPTMIPAEGYDQIIHFAGVRTAPGEFAAAAVEQEFTVFANTFYYGIPPAEWSFINGDQPPF